MKNSLRLFLASVLLGGLTFSSVAFRPAAPVDDYATIYVYRGSQYEGAALNYTVYVNGAAICKLSNGRYIEYQVKPGTLAIAAEQGGGIKALRKETALNLTVEAGHNYYVRGDNKRSVTRSRMELSEVTESTAKRDLSKLAVDKCQRKGDK